MRKSDWENLISKRVSSRTSAEKKLWNRGKGQMIQRIILLSMITVALPACNLAERLSTVGDPPVMTQIQNPTLFEGYQPVSMPMPAPDVHETHANSLWQTGSRAFFKDQRANRVGDLLKVMVDLDERHELNFTSNYKRNSRLRSGVGQMFGYQKYAPKVFPKGVNPSALLDLSSSYDGQGNKGDDKFEYKTKFTVTSVITQILPNGNFVIHGRQEVRLQSDIRVIDIRGIVRREDISSKNNTIDYSQIAEARISLENRGDKSDMNAIPWGTQALNRIMPF